MRSFAVLLIAWTLAVAAHAADPAYTAALVSAYDFYQKGKHDEALKGYELASRLAGAGTPERTDAEIGVQNCLIALKRFDEASRLGKRIINAGGASVFVFMNTGFASLESGNYREAIECYHGVHVLEPENIAAIQGLAWSHYRQGDHPSAKKYLRKGLRLDETNASLLELERRISESAWTYLIAGYLTVLDYASPIKDNGSSREILFSATYRNTHTFNLAFSGLSLDFANPGVPRLNERSTLLGYQWAGTVLADLVYGNISTSDLTLGRGEYIFGKVEKGSWLLQGGAGSYDGTAAFSQWGGGYRWLSGNYSLLSLLELLSRKEIVRVAPRNNYGVFTQKHRWDFAPWAWTINYTLGKSSLLLREHGYLVYNAPEELDFIGGGGVEYARDWGTIGYQLGYLQGTHLADPARRDYHSFSHTISYSQRW